MNNKISPISSTTEKKKENAHWQYLFRTVNVIFTGGLLISIIIGGSIGKTELYVIVYICLVSLIENLYRGYYKNGLLAGVLYLFKRGNSKVAP